MPRRRPRRGCASSTRRAASSATSCPSSSSASGTARSRAWPRAPATATASTARGTPRAVPASTSTSCCWTPSPARSRGEVTVDPAIFGYVPGSPQTRSTTDSAPYVPRSVVHHDDFDWGGEVPLRRRWRDTVIYELHVKGMTQLHDRVPEELRGTYAGLASPAVIDYLLDLGVTAVELLPVHEFVSEPGVVQRGLTNYWGYNSIGFFAPHHAYSASGDRGQQVTRVQGHGQGLPRRRSRGDPRRGLQPHRRGWPARSDAVLPRPRRPPLPARRPRCAERHRARRLLGRHRLRQHRRRLLPVRRCA